MGVKASFNNKEYDLIYNSQSGFYEIEIEAPSIGGVYSAEITFEDLIQNIETSTKKIQIWAKEKNTSVSQETLVYFLDKTDLEIKDVVEFEDYEYVIDEETNKKTKSRKAKSPLTLLDEVPANIEEILANLSEHDQIEDLIDDTLSYD